MQRYLEVFRSLLRYVKDMLLRRRYHLNKDVVGLAFFEQALLICRQARNYYKGLLAWRDELPDHNFDGEISIGALCVVGFAAAFSII